METLVSEFAKFLIHKGVLQTNEGVLETTKKYKGVKSIEFKCLYENIVLGNNISTDVLNGFECIFTLDKSLSRRIGEIMLEFYDAELTNGNIKAQRVIIKSEQIDILKYTITRKVG